MWLFTLCNVNYFFQSAYFWKVLCNKAMTWPSWFDLTRPYFNQFWNDRMCQASRWFLAHYYHICMTFKVLVSCKTYPRRTEFFIQNFFPIQTCVLNLKLTMVYFIYFFLCLKKFHQTRPVKYFNHFYFSSVSWGFSTVVKYANSLQLHVLLF